MSAAPLALGVDIGATRVRVAQAIQTSAGPRVRSVATRDISPGAASSGAIADTSHVAALLEEALAELRTKERRCVCAVGDPDALLRVVTFPPMGAAERRRAARFEAERYADFAIDEAIVQIHPIERATHRWAIGIARSAAIVTRTATLRAAGLRPLAMDHEACALARALPGFDAILDIGHQRASLHIFVAEAPATLQTYSGGADITRGIERELNIDESSAEKRKRILGTAGAGERARATLCSEIASMVETARKKRRIARIAVVGNSARLPGLAADVERATNAVCETVVSEMFGNDVYPQDVVRSSSLDWTLCAGLAAWSKR